MTAFANPIITVKIAFCLRILIFVFANAYKTNLAVVMRPAIFCKLNIIRAKLLSL